MFGAAFASFTDCPERLLRICGSTFPNSHLTEPTVSSGGRCFVALGKPPAKWASGERKSVLLRNSSWLPSVPISLPRPSVPARTVSLFAPAPRAAGTFSPAAAPRDVISSLCNPRAARPVGFSGCLVTECQERHRLPRSCRIISSDDFGRLLHSSGPGSFHIGRDHVSLCALACNEVGRVRFGFTVGKHNVPRSVDRALVKRVLRDCARHKLPAIARLLGECGVGMDVSLRLRTPYRSISPEGGTQQIKARIRRSAQACLDALMKKISVCLEKSDGFSVNS